MCTSWPKVAWRIGGASDASSFCSSWPTFKFLLVGVSHLCSEIFGSLCWWFFLVVLLALLCYFFIHTPNSTRCLKSGTSWCYMVKCFHLGACHDVPLAELQPLNKPDLALF